tara:strand:- start:130 stop:654 length:525 start_codon:yes stop_codon:yes gene_type:complete
MKLFKLIIFFFILLLFNISKINAEQIVYINMEKIMKQSKAGKHIIDKISKSNEKNINKFKKIEEDLKKQEQDLISKKNVMSQNEFQTKLDDLKKKISEYRSKRQNIIQESTKKRVQASAEFSQKIKPILGDYAAKNNISIIVQKKNIIMGKKELDITDDVLKIVDEKITKIKFD